MHLDRRVHGPRGKDNLEVTRIRLRLVKRIIKESPNLPSNRTLDKKVIKSLRSSTAKTTRNNVDAHILEDVIRGYPSREHPNPKYRNCRNQPTVPATLMQGALGTALPYVLPRTFEGEFPIRR